MVGIYRDCRYVICEVGGFVDILGTILCGERETTNVSYSVGMKSNSQHGLTRSGRDAYFDMSV